MRLLRLISLVVVAAGCGDNRDTPDAGVVGDGSVDTGTDGSIGASSRVWVVGNFITSGKRQAGGFTDGAMLPFGDGKPTPVIVPEGNAGLASAAGYTTQVFDVTPDGKKVALVADLLVAGRFDLFLVGANGESPTLLVTGAPNIEIATVSISPSGDKVAFAMDSAGIDNGYDLYWISTTGIGAPVKVSPERPLTAATPSDLGVGTRIVWSADSRYLGFVGDFTEDTYDQGYCADTSTTNVAAELVARTDIPASATSKGVFVMTFDAMNNIYFTGRMSDVSTDIQLYRAKPDGTQRTDVTSLVPARGDNSKPDIGAIGMSADGTKLAIAADTPTAAHYDIFIHTVGTTTTVNTSKFNADWAPNGLFPLAFSPDDSKLAALGRFSTGVRQNPFVINVTSTGARRLINVATVCSGCATPDATQLEWTMDSSALYVRGDITTNNVSKLYRVSANMTDQMPVLAIDSPSAGDVQNVIIRPAAATD